VQGVALRYGVRLVQESHIPKQFFAPNADFGCDPESRVVFYSHPDVSRENPEGLFHELVHVIVQPPGLRIIDVPETMILLMFEDRLSLHLKSEVRKRILDYQGETYVDMYDHIGRRFIDLSEVPNHLKEEMWKSGLERCRQLGLLDEKNRVTWRWPEWDKMPNYKAMLSW
jgi:hypothetical protein